MFSRSQLNPLSYSVAATAQSGRPILQGKSSPGYRQERLWRNKRHAALPPRIESSIGFLVDVDLVTVWSGCRGGDGRRGRGNMPLEADHSTKGSSRRCPSCQGKKTVPFRCSGYVGIGSHWLVENRTLSLLNRPAQVFKEPRACPGPDHGHAMHHE